MKNPEAAKNGRRFYGHGIPRVELEDLAGKLIVVEGADGSGPVSYTHLDVYKRQPMSR